jgi:hypothetical protein
MPLSGASKAKEPRRILPSLIAWEPSKPESDPQVLPEDPLPRVRRAVMPQNADNALSRKDRPETPTPEPEDAIPAQPEALPTQTLVPVQAVSVKAARADRSARAEEVVLPRAERWKRRLHRACW